MRSISWLPARGAPIPACLALAGCAGPSAPTLSLFGAYFPVWILCGIIGVLAAAVTRLLFVALDLSHAIPAQLLVCSAAGLIIACLLWLWLGQ